MTRRLYLLRHAKSSWDDPGQGDHDRPLAHRGRRATKALRKQFARTSLSVDLVLCSTATRTRETWDGVRGGIAGNPEVRFERKVYEAATGTLLDLVRAVDPHVQAVLLIGHNPATADLADTLVGDGADDLLADLAAGYPTGGFAALDVPVPWAEMVEDCATLTEFVRPREL